jgi:exodeoxyribonuclease VII small subunit
MADKKSFEENLNKLGESVKSIERGELPLKETLEKFEEGLKLSKLCIEELENAKQRIEKLTQKNGEIICEPFDVKE